MLFKNNLVNWIETLLIRKDLDDHVYDRSGAWMRILGYYWYNPYFYGSIACRVWNLIRERGHDTVIGRFHRAIKRQAKKILRKNADAQDKQ